MDPEVTRSLVKEGFCISFSEAKRIQSLIPEAEALEEWKLKQKKKTNEVV